MLTLTLTKAAATRIKIINDQNTKAERLRIAVQGGGCSGFQYTFLMDDQVLSDDLVFEKDGAEIVIDEVSLSLLDGSVLDYQDDLTASMFVMTNPNAKTGCGCGNSFSI
jgi:iron-sulfur cluster insertion protein